MGIIGSLHLHTVVRLEADPTLSSRCEIGLRSDSEREQRRQLSIGELCLPRALGEDSRAETALVEDPQEKGAPLLRR